MNHVLSALDAASPLSGRKKSCSKGMQPDLEVDLHVCSQVLLPIQELWKAEV